MNILLVGERYSKNLGDAVICETVFNLIKEQFGEKTDVTMFDISGKIGYDERYPIESKGVLQTIIQLAFRMPVLIKRHPLYDSYQTDQARFLSSLSLLNNILSSKKFDLILFAGGAMFMDYFAGLIYCIVRKASILKIPVIFHACGVSELSKSSIELFRKTFLSKNVKSISIRDSEMRFRDMFDEQVIVAKTYDTALCCCEYYESNPGKIADFGIGIIDLPEYKEEQKNLIRYLLNSHLSWKLFTNGSPNDQKFAETLLKELNVNQSDISHFLSERPQKAEDLVNIVTGFNNIISFRLHSQIIAASYGIPTYGVIWDEKVKDFYESINLPQRCFYPSEILKKLPIILAEQEKLSGKLNVSDFAEESRKNLMDQIFSCLYGGMK